MPRLTCHRQGNSLRSGSTQQMVTKAMHAHAGSLQAATMLHWQKSVPHNCCSLDTHRDELQHTLTDNYTTTPATRLLRNSYVDDRGPEQMFQLASSRRLDSYSLTITQLEGVNWADREHPER